MLAKSKKSKTKVARKSGKKARRLCSECRKSGHNTRTCPAGALS
jgi:hypothetical protein